MLKPKFNLDDEVIIKHRYHGIITEIIQNAFKEGNFYRVRHEDDEDKNIIYYEDDLELRIRETNNA